MAILKGGEPGVRGVQHWTHGIGVAHGALAVKDGTPRREEPGVFGTGLT